MIIVQFQSISKHLLTHSSYLHYRWNYPFSILLYMHKFSTVTLCLCMAGGSTTACMAMAVDFYYIY